MRFSVTIDLGNSEMQTPGAVADALRGVSTRLDENAGSWAYLNGERVRDVNGNAVGMWSIDKTTRESIAVRYTLDELEERPTLSQGQVDDLKIDTGEYRVSLSRCGVEDGEPFDNAVTIEQLIDGSWKAIDRYPAEV